MFDVKNTMQMMATQEELNERQQEMIRTQNRKIHAQREEIQMLKDLSEKLIAENNVLREKLGMEPVEYPEV